MIVGVNVKNPFQLSLGFLQVFSCSRRNASAESKRDWERAESQAIFDTVHLEVDRVPSVVVVVELARAGASCGRMEQPVVYHNVLIASIE